jgi:uncharacterized protein YceH (UPF0502 family)
LRLVQRAALYPQRCAASNRTDGPFIDFAALVPAGRDNRLYLRTKVIEQAGKIVGMVPQEEHDELKAQIESLIEQVEEYDEKIEKFEALIEGLS